MFTERNWNILDVLREVSREVDKPMSQVALAWASSQPGMTSLILGATTPEQLASNLDSLQLTLSEPHLQRLQTASASESGNFYSLFQEPVTRSIFNRAKIEDWYSQQR